MKVGVIGSGHVGQTLGSGFLKHGHEVMMGTREAGKLADWAKQNRGGKVGTLAQTAQFGEVVVLVVKGTAAAEALRGAGKENLAREVVIDETNSSADAPMRKGVLRFFTTLDDSLMERWKRE